ncbi:MAG: glycosyltransferase family 4 protein [Candidatus Omnitrophota bacterium]
MRAAIKIMNIIFITKELPYPVNSGARLRSWHYIQGLTRAGDVCVICGGRKEDNREGLEILEKAGARVVFVDVPDVSGIGKGIWKRLRSLLSPLPHPVFLRVFPLFKAKVNAVVAESQCDLLVCDGIHMALNIPFEISCRKVLDEHNVESTIIGRFLNLARNPFMKIYALSEWLKFRRYEERMWKRFDEIHVCSQIDKRQVETRTGRQNVCVVPNGVSCAEFSGSPDHRIPGKPAEPGNGGAGARLVYSGLMGWTPNNDAALYFAKEIYPLIKHSHDPRTGALEFYIVGKDPAMAVKALAERDPSIIVTGSVPDVKPFIMESDIVVVPLRIGSGTRLKILEAMAMGKPVVSTSIGCEGLDVTHECNILIADEPKDFARQVVRLLTDAQLRERLSEAGRALVEERYDWPLIENQLAELIAIQPRESHTEEGTARSFPRFFVFLAFCVMCLAPVPFARADTVVLKNGREVSGRLLEDNNHYVILLRGALRIVFLKKQVHSIQAGDDAEVSRIAEKDGKALIEENGEKTPVDLKDEPVQQSFQLIAGEILSTKPAGNSNF